MNSILIKRSVKKFIRDYENELVNGLESGGIPKRIGQITTAKASLTQIQPIFIAIFDISTSESFDASALGSSGAIAYSHVVSLASRSYYEIEVHVMDYGMWQSGEEEGSDYEPFEKDTETFETFVARLVDLFRKYTSIPPESGSFTIEVFGDGGETDREIRTQDRSTEYEDSEGHVHFAFYRILQFRLRTCGESTPLSRS